MEELRILCLGDVVARPGRSHVRHRLGVLRKQFSADFVIANGENASGGTGLDPASAEELREAGVDLLTLGDHVWRRKDLRHYLDQNANVCIRPANFAAGAPGQGWALVDVADGVRLGVMNLIGRTFMNSPLDCPFQAADAFLSGPLSDTDLIVCDLHAEATSEKVAMGRYLDGRVSLLFGTHTHIPTADEQILSQGTGYITDLGMCGCVEGVIGLDGEVALNRFLTGLPSSYQAAKGRTELQGILAVLDTKSGKTVSIERIKDVSTG